MITNTGKRILATYLANATSAYASHIAVGSGARPRTVFSVNVATTEASTTTGNNAGVGNALITTATAHDFEIGDYVKIYNNNGSNIASAYIGTWLITSIPNTTSFKFAIGDNTLRAVASPSPQGKVIIDFSNKTSMGLEMLRLPITNRVSFVENGLSKVMFSADLPSAERYEISEIGLYSDASDSTVKVNNKILFNFVSENWLSHDNNGILSITSIDTPLDTGSNTNEITINNSVFRANSDNSLFNNTVRTYRQEKPRMLNSSIFIKGDYSTLTVSSGKLQIGAQDYHVETDLTSSIGLKEVSPNDEIKLAFSVVNKAAATSAPDEIRILLEFSNGDTNPSNYARFHGIVTNTSTQNLTTNRYVVITKKINELEQSASFDWNAVNFVKIYVSVIKTGSPSNLYYVALDAITLNPAASNNPKYGLTGYTIVKNNNNLTITKANNSQQTIQFQYVVGV